MSAQTLFPLAGPELLVAVLLILVLTGFLCWHVCRRTFSRWKLYRDRTRVRREYWGYE